jgi:hypothetical protein
MTPVILERESYQLSILSNQFAIESDYFARGPWDGGLAEARVLMTLENLDTAKAHLERWLAKKQPILIEAAE